MVGVISLHGVAAVPLMASDSLRTSTTSLAEWNSQSADTMMSRTGGELQSADSATNRSAEDTLMNIDAIYTRPFMQRSAAEIGLGGYLEANVQTLNEGGINNGWSFQARRLTLFLSAAPANNLRFLTEIEFENGTEEINIEFASLDVVFSRSFTVRGGIVMIPIGAFNQNHDGPRWNFVDRPTSATQLLPATWSAAGFGLLGKLVFANAAMSYEAYVTNGLDESIVSNERRRTSLPAAKTNPLRFEESFNGHPMASGRLAFITTLFGEVGISYAGGIYNQTTDDGLDVADPLWSHIAALDYSLGTFESPLSLRAEFSYVHVNLPAASEPSYATSQLGGYADVNWAFWRGSWLSFDNSALFLSLRGEYVDWHLPQPTDNGASGDELTSFTLSLAYHPASGTIVRLNYRTSWQTDVLGNPPIRTVALQLGLTTYF